MQEQLLVAEHGGATSEARYKALSGSKGVNMAEFDGVITTPLGPPPAITGDSVRFMASSLNEYSELSTCVLSDAKT